jgi:hypothetical protein
LYPKIRAKTLEILKGYIVHPLLTPAHIHDYITPSEWGDNAGIVGALTLAQVALEERGRANLAYKIWQWVDTNKGGLVTGVVAGAAAAAVAVMGRRK